PSSITRELRAAAVRRFGTIDAAYVAAGARPPKWTPERITRALRRVTHVRPPLRSACIRVFGSVDAARRAAGLPGPVRRRWPRALVIEELRARGGRVDRALGLAAHRHVGGITAARRAAGLALPRQRRSRAAAARGPARRR